MITVEFITGGMWHKVEARKIVFSEDKLFILTAESERLRKEEFRNVTVHTTKNDWEFNVVVTNIVWLRCTDIAE